MAQRGRGAAAGTRPSVHPGVRGPDLADLRARLRAVVEPLVVEAGFDLEDLTVARAGRRFVVRVTVDADGGVSHDELSDISRTVSSGLDAAEESRGKQAKGEIIAEAYTLEVSSPGVDRPLTLPRHWRRNVGRLVRVTVAGEGGATVTARVRDADDAGVTLDPGGRVTSVPYGELGPGHVQVEFARLAGADGDAEEDFDPTGPDRTESDPIGKEDGA